MVITIARSQGVWSMNVNGLNVTPNASLAYLNGLNDMTAGVFALNTSGTATTTTVNKISASLFTGPKLTLVSNGNNLNFTWNVLSAGLLSTTNLSTPNSWVPVAGVSVGQTSYTIPVPTNGPLFYRIAP